MKLLEALEILATPTASEAPSFSAILACGFTPLHLHTFLGAELRRALPEHRVEVQVGLFDDLVGTLESVGSGTDVVVVAIEWPDLEPRLGIRRVGGWRIADIDDAITGAERQSARLVAAICRAAEFQPIVCVLPTLPLPPVFVQTPAEAGPQEWALRELVAETAAELSATPGLRLVSPQYLDNLSPPASRRDANADIATGFPYTMTHAAVVAEAAARLAVPRAPKKGLVTDLDDTLWSGLAGEIGAANVNWNDEAGSHGHGLYQQFIASLASAGVLVAVASKNEAQVVDEVFARADLLLARSEVFPFEVHWDAKSESVKRILQAWNIAADAVVFVDDSPMEGAEVRAAYPEIESFVYPPKDHAALLDLFVQLRDLFGKHETSAEDSIRLDSLRSTSRLRESAGSSVEAHDEFLRSVNGVIQIDISHASDDRAFELVNKTNQFNLNGRRFTEAAFAEGVTGDDAFLVTVSYADKFGPLGKIAALVGRADAGTVHVDAWVMSCRAFSRRIEYHTLAFLFERFAAERIVLAYAKTERNRPLQEFLRTIDADLRDGKVVVDRPVLQRLPATPHQVVAA
jgi:FkbH-like protein